MIPKSFVQELLGRVDIVDVIESYIPLKRAGSNLSACCPFHSEKTPSFTVSPVKQFYHCFGCGAHGTAVGFLIEYAGMGYVEAVKDLAARVGMKVPEVAPSAREVARQAQSEPLTEVLERAAQFYKSELKRSEAAIAYLKGRGLTGEIASRFQLGYAPDGWQSLGAAFASYQAKELVDAGLVIQGEEGKRYDRFRERIMFPIVSQRGQVIGFGGRVLDKSEPKYLNSPETPVFEKGRELYGLFHARQAIRDARRVVVVEGYMDVVALAQHGVGYVVATLGTATTPTHVQKLLRQTDEVVFCFDGDAAGRRAAWRALENSLSQLQDGKQLKFLFLPEQDDPDTYVRREGKQAFEQRVAAAVPLSEFALRTLTEAVNMTTAEGRARFLQDAKPLVLGVNAPILRLMLVKRVAELAGLSQPELEDRFQIRASRRVAEALRRVPEMTLAAQRRSADLYSKLLERVIAQPCLIRELRTFEPPAPVPETAEAVALLQLLEDCRELEQDPTPQFVLELLRDQEAVVRRLQKPVSELEAFTVEELRDEVHGAIKGLRAEAENYWRTQASQAVSSTQELSPEQRALLRRAPEGGKAVKLS